MTDRIMEGALLTDVLGILHAAPHFRSIVRAREFLLLTGVWTVSDFEELP